MKKKIIFLALTLISTLISLTLSSCNKEDEVYSLFYLQFNGISRNVVDENGKSISEKLMKETFYLKNGQRLYGTNEPLGRFKTYHEACEGCEKELLPLVTELNEMYCGKSLLPEDGYINYNFTLSEFQSGNIADHPCIHVTNAGAIYQ